MVTAAKPLEEDISDLPPPPSPGEDISGLPPPPVADKPKNKTFGERGTQLLESVVGGTAMGAASPEITQYVGKGMQKLPVPYAKPIGMGLEQTGKMMKRQRLTEMGIGAVGGGTGDIAGQTVEFSGGSSPMVFAAELAGGVVGPAFMNTIKSVVSYGARKFGLLDPVSAVKTVADDLSFDEKLLSPSQRDFIKNQIEQFRGGAPGSKSQEGLYDVLRTGVLDITGEAERRALAKKAEAEMTQRGAETQAEKMRLAGKKTTQIGAETAAQAKAARATVGTEREASDVGNTLRNRITELFGNLAEKRSADYQAQKAIRDAAVAKKESAGILLRDMEQYQNLLSDLRGKLLRGAEAQTQKTAKVTEPGVLGVYENIYTAVSARKVATAFDENGKPTAFKFFPTSLTTSYYV